MTERARREYAEVLRRRYVVADMRERGRIVDEYCRTTHGHRKAAIRRLGQRPRPAGRPPGRPRHYGRELLPLLERVWRASDYLSGKLLVAILPRLLAALEQQHGVVVAPPLRVALTAASPAPLDRLLRPLRPRRPRQPRRLAPALGTLRAQVPLRTWSEWSGVAPGALQGDRVLHCGESTAGFSLATLVAVDVATTWTELQAVWGLHHRRVSSGIHLLRQRLPVPLRAWHSDNGGEFLHACLVAWCRLVGYDHRSSSRAAFAVLQRLYGLLRLQHNFFRPVRTLRSTRRVGSTVVKRYDAPRTPYQRMLLSDVLTEAQRQALAQQCQALDPLALARDIQLTLDLLWTLADTRPRREAARG